MAEAHAIDVRSEWRTFSDSVRGGAAAECSQMHFGCARCASQSESL